ncbi:MAG: SDR family NAD(P)-dependent oxidoreductase [Pseudomonadota bacterium]
MSVWQQIATPSDGAAWVTGASGGIGRALCLSLARRGWEVHATARRLEALTDLKAEAEAAGHKGRIVPAPGDVTDLAAMADIVSAITAARPLALAVLNAGIYTPMRAQEFRAAVVQKHLDVNVQGVANGLEPVLAHMIGRGAGHVALMASVAGYRGLPDATAYSPTKAAVISMAEALAMDLASRGVRISVINPGFVETEATSVNDFEMPFLMKAEDAGERIAEGLAKPGFEIRFPLVFALILRLIGLLPNRAYIWAVRKATGWDTVAPRETPPAE